MATTNYEALPLTNSSPTSPLNPPASALPPRERQGKTSTSQLSPSVGSPGEPSEGSLSSHHTYPSPSTPGVPKWGSGDFFPAPNPTFRSRPGSAMSMSTAGYGMGTSTPMRSSMVLYRLANEGAETSSDVLLPPRPSHLNRDSLFSVSGDSIYSLDDTSSKYAVSNGPSTSRGLVPYAYDPSTDEQDPPDEEDDLHDPSTKIPRQNRFRAFTLRGITNLGALALLIMALLVLFVAWPVLDNALNGSQRYAITVNPHVNGSGQAAAFFALPSVVDEDTPESARSRTGFDGNEYVLVFSDEFNVDGRTFYPGDDPFWEAVDLWYGATADLEWYDPRQITTRDGNLVITVDSIDTTEVGVTPGSTAPFTMAENHGLAYRSGMLQSWNKFCFTTGYIEVAVILPGPHEDTEGYWPGVWTMGNLARPGYPATTDGLWPYTYDSCDVGTFPNQTNPDGQSPAAALFSEDSRSRYNNELSWLPGQRLSACSCPGSDHPGPSVSKGRGSPEIDILEAQLDEHSPDLSGHVISQSAQFAPFTHDYLFDNSTEDLYAIYDSEKTMQNVYRGSAIQQSVSTLSKVPADGFWGLPNRRHVIYGFEYWANPSNRDEGYITWVSDGSPDVRVSSRAVGPDPESVGGSGVGQRLIPEEPMTIVLNVGLSNNWETPVPSTMIFPTEMLVDYVRVYQRKGSENIGCDPEAYPTKDYIERHLGAYMNPNQTTWDAPIPVNSLYNQGC